MMLPPISQSFSWLSWYRGVLDVADRLVRFPAGPRVRLKTADAPKGNGLAQKKRCLPIGPTNCFHCASKLLRGTFWAGLRTLKTVAAALEGLSTAQLSAAALEASRWLCNGASLLAPQSVSIGLRNCGVARFRQALKFQNPRSSFRRPQHRRTLRSSFRSVLLYHGASLLALEAVSIGLRNCRVACFGQVLKS